MKKIVWSILASTAMVIASPTISTEIILEKSKGSQIDGSAWSSSMLQGKITALVYVDPDKSGDNEIWETLTKEADFFQYEKFQSIAIINTSATWSPDFAINLILEQKQQEFPKTVYVRDFEKHLVNVWGLSDDAYNILLINEKGELLFHADTTLSKSDSEAFIEQVIKYSKERK